MVERLCMCGLLGDSVYVCCFRFACHSYLCFLNLLWWKWNLKIMFMFVCNAYNNTYSFTLFCASVTCLFILTVLMFCLLVENCWTWTWWHMRVAGVCLCSKKEANMKSWRYWYPCLAHTYTECQKVDIFHVKQTKKSNKNQPSPVQGNKKKTTLTPLFSLAHPCLPTKRKKTIITTTTTKAVSTRGHGSLLVYSLGWPRLKK